MKVYFQAVASRSGADTADLTHGDQEPTRKVWQIYASDPPTSTAHPGSQSLLSITCTISHELSRHLLAVCSTSLDAYAIAVSNLDTYRKRELTLVAVTTVLDVNPALLTCLDTALLATIVATVSGAPLVGDDGARLARAAGGEDGGSEEYGGEYG